jgi:hypothetical protein
VHADFLERTRRYSFMVTLGVMLYVAYAIVPAVESGVLTVDLGNLRGIYNSPWIGGLVALQSSLLLSLPGFYLVKNAVRRDRQTGVGQIVATTPLSKVAYLTGKTLSNFLFLALISLVVMVAAAGMQLLRGEVTQIQPWHLLAPWLFATLPTLLVVAAVAVFFESVPFLSGGFGNIVFFFLYITVVIVSLSGATFNDQGVIVEPVNDLFGATVIGASMLRSAHAAYPDRSLDFGVGYTKVAGPVDTFRWPGVDWTADLAVGRLVWVVVAVGIVAAASLIFNRFDPARGGARRRGRGGGRLRRLYQRLVNGVSARVRRLREGLPRLRLRLPLPPLGRVFVAEMKMALSGQRWWWYLVTLGIIVGNFTAQDPEARRGLWLAAWLWPVLVWSKLGVREVEHRTGPVVFSAPRPLLRQLPATWLAGAMIAVVMGIGPGFRFLATGQIARLAAWAVGVLFIPTAALTAAVWSGDSKLFEAAYVVAWYIGPVSGLVEADFMGANPASVARGIYRYYLVAIPLLLVLTVVGRARRIRA